MRLLSTLALLVPALVVGTRRGDNLRKPTVLDMEFDEIPDKSQAEGVEVKFDASAAIANFEEDLQQIAENGYTPDTFKDEKTGAFKIAGVPQWVLLHQDLIEEGNVDPGWSNNSTITCYGAGTTLLGPHAATELKRTYKFLPPHAELRVRANFHFVDGWLGESGFMKASVGPKEALAYVWTDQHAQDRFSNGYDLCGRNEVPEAKFLVPIDVTLPHNADDLVLVFGSTMDINNPSAAFWGVSNVEIYIH